MRNTKAKKLRKAGLRVKHHNRIPRCFVMPKLAGNKLCKCGARISANKKSCLTCASKLSELVGAA